MYSNTFMDSTYTAMKKKIFEIFIYENYMEIIFLF